MLTPASPGETIPIRLFLGGFDLTPTFRDINKKFSTRYYLNLVLIDEENRRYFKQQVSVFVCPLTVFSLPPPFPSPPAHPRSSLFPLAPHVSLYFLAPLYPVALRPPSSALMLSPLPFYFIFSSPFFPLPFAALTNTLYPRRRSRSSGYRRYVFSLLLSTPHSLTLTLPVRIDSRCAHVCLSLSRRFVLYADFF